MEGTIIKGERMPKYLRDLTFETLGGYDSTGDYFVAKTPIGILIFNVIK